ncbi:MAG: ubiquinol-cytochrome c reductase iron-sulfur subunit [Opitutae bacterium]|nr:ubiquinol-cytochrome c reductase iron-sulfur subunit [Opitutae bacterium]
MNQGHSSPSAPRAPQPGKGDSRRDFIWLTLGWLASLFALGASGFATLRSLVPNVLYEPSRRFKAGRPGDYPDDTATFIEEVRLFIVRKGSTYRAMSAICPHLGCTVNATVGKHPFLCPCHGSHFSPDGAVMSGPSPRGLTWHALSLSKDGRLVVDLDRAVTHDKTLVIQA